MFEHRRTKPLSQRAFFLRVARQSLYAFGLIALSLLVGMLGYHYLGDLNWVDSFMNASMILGGMGPVDPLKSDAAKIFAGVYALYAGLVLLGTASFMLAPFAHRLLHKFHFEEE